MNTLRGERMNTILEASQYIGIMGAIALCLFGSGCKKETNRGESPDQGEIEASKQEAIDESVTVEATQEIRLEDLPTLQRGDEISLDPPIYEARFHATEDGTTRAWIEINDLGDEEFEALAKHASQFSDGKIIAPPSAPGIPASHDKVKRYTLAQLGGEARFEGTSVGWTYYQGPGESHVIHVAIPDKKLEEKEVYIAVPGAHPDLRFTAPSVLTIDDKQEEAAASMFSKLREHTLGLLRDEERAMLPEELTDEEVKVFSGAGYLPEKYSYLAVLTVPASAGEEEGGFLSGMFLLGDNFEVKGLIEAPAVRDEQFIPMGVIDGLDKKKRGHFVYETLHYEGSYHHLLTFDDRGQAKLVMLYGDGL